jgi:hypothetical protein
MQNQNPSDEETKRILNSILDIKEQIWETKSYISSDFCLKCSQMYEKIHHLEEELRILQDRISNDHS